MILTPVPNILKERAAGSQGYLNKEFLKVKC
jgi:hypothetical protein